MEMRESLVSEPELSSVVFILIPIFRGYFFNREFKLSTENLFSLASTRCRQESREVAVSRPSFITVEIIRGLQLSRFQRINSRPKPKLSKNRRGSDDFWKRIATMPVGNYLRRSCSAPRRLTPEARKFVPIPLSYTQADFSALFGSK